MPVGYALSFHGNTDNARDTEFAGLVENTLVGLFILVIFSLLFECNQQRKMGEGGGEYKENGKKGVMTSRLAHRVHYAVTVG